MDFPLFHLDFFGNRLLIATIAILHVLVNHALAVGFLPLVVLLEYLGFRKRRTDPGLAATWDDVVRRIMLVGFIITTTVGAMTGVGIWLSASLVNPASLGSLIRVFYGAWFTEWIIFILEVVFIMIYFLTWRKAGESETAKVRHIRFGTALVIFSWLTMAIIVGILAFMMDTGSWTADKTFISGFVNPLYLPQLLFRTPLAMMMGGAFALLLLAFFARRTPDARRPLVSFTSLWLLVWTPMGAVGAAYYYLFIPDAMVGNLPTAVGTMAFMDWHSSLLTVILVAVLLSVIIALWGFLAPRRLPGVVMALPIIVLMVFLGSFERIREFIRKPYVIGDYMYANGLRMADYPLYRRDGLLAHATYVDTPAVTADNTVAAGRNVFMLACSRCHTVRGVNSVITKFKDMSSDGRTLDPAAMKSYIPKMHNVWFYMPPFPGTAAELDALVDYIIHMDKHADESLPGAQDEGVAVAHEEVARTDENRRGEGGAP
ncbi:MAG: cytochrome c [Acidobacteria bacterium]|nr:cytochrome c [Acidobacteriota bacterium]